MTREKIIKAVKEHESQCVKFAVVDIDGILRGKSISRKKFFKSLDDDIGVCNVVFGWDSNDTVYDNSKITGWHTGYPDSMASVDLSTFRQIPWEKETPFFLGDFHVSDELADICPRTLLKRISGQSEELGFKPKFSSEYEWFNFQETPHSLKEKAYQNPTPITPGMFGYSMLRSSLNSDYFSDLFHHLHRFGIPLEGLHTETGDGACEAAIEYADILEAADRSVLFKTGVKEIAYRHEIIASFMAKWNINLPGCSGHIHQSLWDEKGEKNLFYDSAEDKNISSLMKHYIAGQLLCLPYILPMYAPTVNSYKRFVAGSWASTTVSWGFDNRTTALRVIAGEDYTSARLETRVPGADINPYLAMAAALASGLYGITHELTLDISPTKGNEYETGGNQPLPKTLKEAVDAMKSSDIPSQLFGEKFTDHFIRTREWEWEQYSKQVTNWELQRYFEII